MEQENTFLKSRGAANIMLLLTALLWGSSYSFRKMGLEHMTPFFFNFLIIRKNCKMLQKKNPNSC